MENCVNPLETTPIKKRMAIFTFDDLNEMKHDEADFFGPTDMNISEELSPSTASISFIRNYSQSVSIKASTYLGDIRLNLN